MSYNRRDLVTYAVGIGCTELPFVYENNKAFAAFPTYPIVLGFKGSDQDIVAFPSEAMKKQPMCALPGKVGRRLPPLCGRAFPFGIDVLGCCVPRQVEWHRFLLGTH